MPKEIVFTSRDSIELLNYEDAPLGPHDVRGATLCTLVSQGTELAWASGEDFPLRPGYGAIFRVDEVGEAVKHVPPGEHRFCMGAHRSTQQHAAEFTLPLPDGLEPNVAVIARLMGVSMTTLMTTRARPGDKVVVTGAGPVGLLAVQNFRIGGYEVAAVEPARRRREQLASVGGTAVFGKMPLEDPAYAGKVALVVECSGNEQAVVDACNFVRPGGEVVLVGVPWKRMTNVSAHEVVRPIFFNQVHLRGGWEWELPIRSRRFVWEELFEGYNNSPHSILGGFGLALRWLAEDRVPVGHLTTTLPPESPAVLYADIAEGRVSEPLIVLDWTGMA